jgi:hypothetical protein
MPLPVTIPNTFAGATSAIPLSQLDNNFTTVVNGINGIGNGTNSLANVSITGGNITTLTTALSVANGGTGATTITANNVVLGNGTSVVKVVAPGTSGNVLTSDGTTWASAASGGGGGTGSWIYLSTVTASNVATADIETTFNSTYNNYAIVASAVSTVSSTRLTMRFKVSGSYSSSALYGYAVIYNANGASRDPVGEGQASETEILINPMSPTVSANLTTNFICYLYNTASTSLYKTCNIVGQSWSSSSLGNFINTVTYRDTPAVTGVRIFAATGNVSGTFRLYGIKNS